MADADFTQPEINAPLLPRAYSKYEAQTINRALKIMERHFRDGWERISMQSPSAARNWMRLSIGHFEVEVFKVIFLDAQLRLICAENLFTGTLNQTSVYPREVIKRALEVNAASVIFAHNHPSGNTKPSQADLHLTKTLRQALNAVDINVLDHFIVTSKEVSSFAENGIL